MRYVIDIDGILCDAPATHGAEAFANRKPNLNNIKSMNWLYDNGFHITIFTARKSTDPGVVVTTKEWLLKQGARYHELIFDKPIADVYIDDHATCNFPESRGLFVMEQVLKEETWIFCYLNTDPVKPKECLALPDRYLVRITPEGLWASAQGEFIRDKDLKEEALVYVKLILEQTLKSKTKIVEKVVPFPLYKQPGESEN